MADVSGDGCSIESRICRLLIIRVGISSGRGNLKFEHVGLGKLLRQILT